LINGIISFALIVFASWCVGEGGEILGERFDASIIGGLLIAWLNTTPEAIFFVSALRADQPRFAVGAVSGSSIVVSTIALGACIYIGAGARQQKSIVLQPAVRRQCMILLASTLVPILVCFTGFNALVGFLGIAYYIAFLVFSVTRNDAAESSGSTKKVDDVEVGHTSGDDADADAAHGEEFGHDGKTSSLAYGCGLLLLGAALIFLCSHPFIESVVKLAQRLNVNPVLLAFFLAPIASEMPEILESISLSRRGRTQSINIAFSNLVGGTMTKTTLLCSVLSFFGVQKSFAWETPSYTISLAFLILSAAVASTIGWLVERPRQLHGALLGVLFAGIALVQYLINSKIPDAIPVDVADVDLLP